MSEKGEVPAVEALEGKVLELETLADSLEGVPEDEVVEAIERAVELLGEINAGLEENLRSAQQEERDAGEVLNGVDLGPFDEALEDILRRENPSGESER